MSVAEIDALLYLPDHPRAGSTARCASPRSAPVGRSRCRRCAIRRTAPGVDAAELRAHHRRARRRPGADSARCASSASRRRAAAISSLRLAAADGAPLPAALPGQFITVRLQPSAGAAPVIRSYSLSSRPGAPEYRISVKREPHGAASGYLHTQCASATSSTSRRRAEPSRWATASCRCCCCQPASARRRCWRCCMRSPPRAPTRPVWWLHGARDASEHAFAAESRALLAQLPNARVHVCYSRPAAGDQPGRDYASAGRLSAALLGELAVPSNADAYLCGPAELPAGAVAPRCDHTGSMRRASTARSSAPHRRSPPALPPPPPRRRICPAGAPGPGPAVAFARSGLRVNWDPQYASLLELAEACGVPTRWSCRTGVCHTCETGLLSGAVRYRPEPLEAPADGNVLVCCAQPEDDVVLDL